MVCLQYAFSNELQVLTFEYSHSHILHMYMFCSSMKGLMNCTPYFSTKGLSTHIIFIWFLSSMNSPMNYKPFIYTKGLATYITFIWFLSGMNSPMNSKVWLSSKAMATYFTCIRFLSSMKGLAFCLKAFPHRSHLHGFSPVWTRRWCWSCVCCLKQWPHISHLYGFSPVWFLWQTIRVDLSLKALQHVTFICFSSCMHSLMSSKFCVLKKSYVTLITTVSIFLVCIQVWYQFWGMYNSTLLFMRIAFTDTTRSLRW